MLVLTLEGWSPMQKKEKGGAGKCVKGITYMYAKEAQCYITLHKRQKKSHGDNNLPKACLSHRAVNPTCVLPGHTATAGCMPTTSSRFHQIRKGRALVQV